MLRDRRGRSGEEAVGEEEGGIKFSKRINSFLYFSSLITKHKMTHCEANHIFSIKIMLQLEVPFRCKTVASKTLTSREISSKQRTRNLYNHIKLCSKALYKCA